MYNCRLKFDFASCKHRLKNKDGLILSKRYYLCFSLSILMILRV
nr:MAG TPA: hypothetical protein [Caudoviricetes sp.]